jgi:hypothetical protein
MKAFGRVLNVGTFFLFVLGSAQAQSDVADVILLSAKVFTACKAHPHAEQSRSKVNVIAWIQRT